MKMQRYYEREKLTYDEKYDISQKSNEQCCHCGKKVYFSYGATVDHFIPLDKGGSNHHRNLIMLCHDCNQDKGNKIVPISYVPYLNDKHKKELSDYVDSYLQVVDYVQRNRLLAYNEYELPICVQANDFRGLKGYSGHKNKIVPVSKSKLKLATWDDLDKLHRYMVKYLKKVDALDDEESARQNVIFWLQFGCIYYIEHHGEISHMIAITIKHVTEEESYRGCEHIPHFYMFPYYDSDISNSITLKMMSALPQFIIEETELEYMPVVLLMLYNDKIIDKLAYFYKESFYPDNITGFMKLTYVVGDVDNTTNQVNPNELSEKEIKTKEFFKKFDNVTDKMVKYFDKYVEAKEVSWMINGIMSYDYIKQTSLNDFFEDIVIMVNKEGEIIE